MKKVNTRFVTQEIGRQFSSVIDMLQIAVDTCPESIWTKEFADVPFWQEVYHSLFWLSHTARKKGQYHPAPFGIDVYPMFDEKPTSTVDKKTAANIIKKLRHQISLEFAELNDEDLQGKDTFDDLDNVLKRLLNSLRHAQHHIGKLTSYLYVSGIDFLSWTY